MKKKLLYICPHIPQNISGNELRSFQQFAYLNSKYDVYVIPIIRSNYKYYSTDSFKDIKVLKTNLILSIFKTIYNKDPLQVNLFFSKNIYFSLKKFIADNNIELLFISHIRLVKYSNLLSNKSNVILDFIDCVSSRFSLKSKKSIFPINYLYKKESELLLRCEKYYSNYLNKSIITTKEDKAKICQNNSKIKVITQPNDTELYSAKNIKLVYLGDLNAEVNIVSIIDFVENVFFKIIEKHKNIQLFVCGITNSKKILKLNEHKNIIVTGFIYDIESVFKLCDIAVFPLKFGSGIKNRILQFANNNIPIIGNEIINEGVNLINGKEIILINSNTEFFNKLNKLIMNPIKRKKIAKNAFKKITIEFNPKLISKKYEKLFNK